MTKPDTTGVPPAIRELLERLNQGFARRDVQRVLNLFASGPEIMFIGSEPGEIAAGPEQLRNLLAGLFARGEIYQWRWGELHLSVTGDIAWLVAQAVLLVEGPEPLELPYRITLVLQRCNSAWLIAHYHGSEPAAGPGDEITGGPSGTRRSLSA
jgi:ketosteroid isomerase-like protein